MLGGDQGAELRWVLGQGAGRQREVGLLCSWLFRTLGKDLFSLYQTARKEAQPVPLQRFDTNGTVTVIINREGEASGVAGLNNALKKAHSNQRSNHCPCFIKPTAAGAFPPSTNNF